MKVVYVQWIWSAKPLAFNQSINKRIYNALSGRRIESNLRRGQLAVCRQFATSWRQFRQVWTNLPTAKSSCVVLAVWTHPSAVVTQFTISCAVELASDDIMTSLLKKLSISIKIHVIKPLCSVSKLTTESVGSRRELVANSCTLHTADATRQLSRVGVGGVYWAFEKTNWYSLLGVNAMLPFILEPWYFQKF